MAATGLHISISPETLTTIAGLPITNSMLTSVITSGLILAFAFYFRSTYRSSSYPKGLGNAVEMIIEGMVTMVDNVTQSAKKTARFFPLFATFFVFITLNNWIGLLPGVGTIGFMEESTETVHEVAKTSSVIPQAYAVEAPAAETVQAVDDHGVPVGVTAGPDAAPGVEVPHEAAPTEEPHAAVFVPYFRAGTADLNMTIALGVLTQIMAQYYGFSYLGLGYLKKFINFSNPVNFFVGLLELLGEFTKIISFAFRLFGNVFAGEVLIAVMMYLTKVVVPMPFYALELFVGAIQGLVFAMLSLVFYNMATIGHGDEH